MTAGELLAQLAAAGASREIVTLVTQFVTLASREHHAPSRKSTAVTRAQSAARSRRYRAKKKRDAAVTHHAPVTRDATEIAISILPLQEKGLSVVKKESKRARNCGERLPDDWRPAPEHYEQGAALSMTRADVDSQAEDMRLWARSNEHRAVARKSDWNLTFTGWLRRNRTKAHGGMNGKRTVQDAARDQLARFNEPVFAEFGGGTGGHPPRLLPKG